MLDHSSWGKGQDLYIYNSIYMSIRQSDLPLPGDCRNGHATVVAVSGLMITLRYLISELYKLGDVDVLDISNVM